MVRSFADFNMQLIPLSCDLLTPLHNLYNESQQDGKSHFSKQLFQPTQSNVFDEMEVYSYSLLKVDFNFISGHKQKSWTKTESDILQEEKELFAVSSPLTLPPLLANIIRHCSTQRVECVGPPWVFSCKLWAVVGCCFKCRKPYMLDWPNDFQCCCQIK